ncbi:DUF485 domain-containing protein [Agilicoccus flavus]|uniref:DUF485 domain-containing protein n=1 Tax=Agilicoccus flavus TaxID=2775968 RepID=UPI001CF619A7|nr:DUF485 domain-containing protein [Agilicoccus flavus]
MAPSAPAENGREYGEAGSHGYEAVQNSDEFQDLRRRFRGFVFPWTAFFLVWYFLYVILAAYFPAFMSTKLFGNINVGLVFGLLQFVTTFGITILYVRWADREFDPRAEAIRDRVLGTPGNPTAPGGERP